MKTIKLNIVNIIRYIVNIYFKMLFKLNNKEKIFIYTDSRGFLVNCFLCNKTPYKSYISILSKYFNIYYQLCTKKHTTILDFLEYSENHDLTNYSHIILHIGIVDFSPRPLSQIDLVFNTKNKIVNKLFPTIEMKPNYYEDMYEGEKTFSLYDIDFLVNTILPKLNEISQKTNIIWIGLNKVDLKWNGNYFKARPSNINNILHYQKTIIKYLKNADSNMKYINIEKINGFDAKTHTLDNMHLSNDGFQFLSNILLDKLLK